MRNALSAVLQKRTGEVSPGPAGVKVVVHAHHALALDMQQQIPLGQQLLNAGDLARLAINCKPTSSCAAHAEPARPKAQLPLNDSLRAHSGATHHELQRVAARDHGQDGLLHVVVVQHLQLCLAGMRGSLPAHSGVPAQAVGSRGGGSSRKKWAAGRRRRQTVFADAANIAYRQPVPLKRGAGVERESQLG